MVSVYEYTTLAALESFTFTDYSLVYPDIVEATINASVESVITQCEREINTKVGESFTGTIPDAIISLTMELAFRRMYNRMVWDGIMDRENPKRRLMPIWDDDTKGILKDYLDKTKNADVDLIATYSGRDNSNQGLSFIP